MITEPALIEGVEKMNAVVMRGQKQEQAIRPPRRDPYAMEINKGRNYYACGGFGHIA